MGSSVILPGAGQPTTGADKSFRSSSIPNVVSFRFRDVTPPSAVYTQRDDVVVFQGNTTLAGGDTVTLTLRLLLPYPPEPGQPDAPVIEPVSVPGPGQVATSTQETQAKVRVEYERRLGPGYVVVVTQQLVIPTPGTSVSVIITIAEGYLLSAAVLAKNAVSFGQTYVTVYIGRGTPGGALPFPAELLIADYPTNLIPVGWPGVPIRQSASGQGTISVVTHANLSGTGGAVFTGLAGLRYLLHSVNFVIAANVTVATRIPNVAITDVSGNLTSLVVANQSVTASQTWTFHFALGVADFAEATTFRARSPLASVFFVGAGVVNIDSENGVAGDVISAITLELETWVA